MTALAHALRARAHLASASIALASAALASGCIIEDRHHGGGFYGGPPIIVPPDPPCPIFSTNADNAALDTNDAEGISSPPGDGVGVLVDYDTGGHWHVWSVCDTAVTGRVCGYAVTAQTVDGTPVTDIAGDDLEVGERAGAACADTAFFAASTDLGIDGMRFTAAPGIAVQIKAVLDGTLFPDIIFFAQSGAAATATTNPMTLTPASP
jgi:hypothetical protein